MEHVCLMGEKGAFTQVAVAWPNVILREFLKMFGSAVEVLLLQTFGDAQL